MKSKIGDEFCTTDSALRTSELKQRAGVTDIHGYVRIKTLSIGDGVAYNG